MKRTSPALIVSVVAVTFFVVGTFYNRLSTNLVFQKEKTRFRRSSAPNYNNPSLLLPHSAQHTFTCKANQSAVIDSFGTPCLNLTKTIKGQMVFVQSSGNPSHVFCGIPKNGCTYHVGIMHRLMGYPYEGAHNVHGPGKDRLRQHANMTQLLLSEDVPKYIVVRNPMYRVLSAYLNKVERYMNESQKTPETFHKWIYEDEALKPGMTSEERRNPHWKSQVSFCGFKIRDFTSYFRIFRVEKPAEYVDYLESNFPEHMWQDGWDMPRNVSLREHVLGPRKRTENTTARFFNYMGNLQTFDYLTEVYREDIDLLGYEEEVEELRERLVVHLEDTR